MEKQEVPIWEKANLTIDEAAAYFGKTWIQCNQFWMEAGMQRMLYPGFATGKLQKTY